MHDKDSEHLQWIHDRLQHVYHENPNFDFMHRLREIIETVKKSETKRPSQRKPKRV